MKVTSTSDALKKEDAVKSLGTKAKRYVVESFDAEEEEKEEKKDEKKETKEKAS